MNSPLRVFSISILTLLAASGLRGADDSFHPPDSILLKNGKTIHGLIIKNTVDSVILQEKSGENTYYKKDIVRIRDEADLDAMYTDITRKGSLPAWRVIANDLRTHDAIKSLVQIPATGIDKGEFKNVPYLSFRANRDIELNIYGDPENPAGFEMGIYGGKAGNDKLRQDIRAFLAGFLSSRAEVAMLYSLNLNEGIGTAGELTIEITPKNGLDAYGAWWISLYNKKSLAKDRLSDAAYAKITRPSEEVVDKHGNVLAADLPARNVTLADQMKDLETSAKLLLRGFYRDKDGNFRMIFEPKPEPTPRQ